MPLSPLSQYTPTKALFSRDVGGTVSNNIDCVRPVITATMQRFEIDLVPSSGLYSVSHASFSYPNRSSVVARSPSVTDAPGSSRSISTASPWPTTCTQGTFSRHVVVASVVVGRRRAEWIPGSRIKQNHGFTLPTGRVKWRISCVRDT